MEKLKFLLSETIYDGSFGVVGDNIVSLKINDAPSDAVISSGFLVLNEHNLEVMGTYEDYVTIYRKLDNGTVQLSNNGTIYVPPTRDVEVIINWNDNDDEDGIRPTSVGVTLYMDGVKKSAVKIKETADWKYVFDQLPADSTYEVTVDDVLGYDGACSGCSITETHTPIATVRANKVAELNQAQQDAIKAGADVQLTDGTVEHFTLSDHDQMSIMELSLLVATGSDKIPWHTSNQAEPCKYYSNADMTKIIEKTNKAVSYQVALFRDFRIYINSLSDADVISGIAYDVAMLPEEYRSEVLKDLME